MATRWKCNRWMFSLIASACGLVIYIAAPLAPRLNNIAASGNSSHALDLEQGIRETDRNFLDNLVRENNQADHDDGNLLPTPQRGAVKATIAENLKVAPRAESIEDGENERHKAKVARIETPTASVRPKSIRKSVAGSE